MRCVAFDYRQIPLLSTCWIFLASAIISTIMSNMKSITMRDLSHRSRQIANALEAGESFALKKRNKVIATITPTPRKPWPDRMRRMEAIFHEKIFSPLAPSDALISERDER